MSDPQTPNSDTPPPWAGQAAAAPQAPNYGQPQAPSYPQPQAYANPAYGQPQVPPGYGATPPPSAGRGLGLASLITGIGSIVFAIFVGFLAGAVAIVLGILGLKKPAARGLSIGGIITGGIGMLLSIVVLIVGIIVYSAQQQDDQYVFPETTEPSEEPQTEGPVAPLPLSFLPVTTPCYGFDGPSHFVNNISSADAENCLTELELWGEMQDDGTILATGVGAVFGNVNVEPVSAAFVAEHAPGGTLEEIMAFLETDYFPTSGQGVIQTTDVPLDGAAAKLTFLIPNSEETQLRAVIAVLPPKTYSGANGDIGMFLITVSTAEDNGEKILESVLNTWKWQ